MELTRQADGEVADVDHLLNLAQPLGRHLAGFQGHQPAQILFGGAQFVADQGDQPAALRRRHQPPAGEGIGGAADGGARLVGGGIGKPGDLGAIERRAGDAVAGGQHRIGNAQTLQNGAGLVCGGGPDGRVAGHGERSLRMGAETSGWA